MATTSNSLECPLCPFTVTALDTYVLELHFEQEHTTDSPFKIQDDPEPLSSAATSGPAMTSRDAASNNDDGNWMQCPEPDCGEEFLIIELNEHLDYHAAERLNFDVEAIEAHHSDRMQTLSQKSSPSFLEQNFTSQLPDSLRNHQQSSNKLKRRRRGNSGSSDKSTISRSILSFNPFASKANKVVKPPASTVRLGRAELGPFAWEDRMPKWLHKQLEDGPKVIMVNRIGRDGRLIKEETVSNETPGVIPILAQLSALDRSVKEAYYCHPSTLHIGKTPKEGGFCGYRNIQMMISYIQGARAQGHEEFTGRTPGILKLQDLIERAWDRGINEIGRQQTGGIRDTRKYIGTPEAQALFLSSQIDCAVEMFNDSPDGQIEAHEQLFAAVEKYFKQAAYPDSSNVFKTLLPPIYLQQPGHSITIVGFEHRKDGNCNLVIYDPMFRTSPGMHRLIGRKNIKTPRPEILHAYRRGAKQLRKHAAFEVLMLTGHAPLFPAWDVLRQFPDCRFLYVFFRSRTLGYDVYPEDHFLRNFPWQQYGGLWIVDHARFARAERINPLTAAALRRITGQRASPSLNTLGQSTTTRTSYSLNPLKSLVSTGSRKVSCMSALDGSPSGPVSPLNDREPVLKPIGPHAYAHDPHFKGDQGSGYPRSHSPTLSARFWYPSPRSESGSCRLGSPISIYGSEKGDPCGSYSNMDMAPINLGIITQAFNSSSDTLHSSQTSISPTSPVRLHSPRTSMLRAMYQKQQAFQDMGQNLGHMGGNQTTPPSIKIANGIETSEVSPFSPSGTILSYTSNRTADSGLLAVKPLDEAQVAQYRFWQACGRRACPFGCGSGEEGEFSAGKRLFKEVVDIKEDDEEAEEKEVSG